MGAYIAHKLHQARGASRVLAVASTSVKNEALHQMADALWNNREEILAANEEDVRAAEAAGQPASRIDRLMLNEHRIRQMMDGLCQVAQLEDPIGERLDTILHPNGMRIEKVRVPMGVIAMVYESRPNVTVDAVGLCIKTGNAAVLRGGREALRSNIALVRALHKGLQTSGVPSEALQFVERTERESVDLLIRAVGLVDLVIPRGGAGLIERVVRHAQVPVIETGVGNCHVYVDASADVAKARDIITNAKTQRPSVCNAAETLLVHKSVASAWLPEIVPHLVRLGVQVRGCEQSLSILRDEGFSDVSAATKEDWSTEYLDLILAVKVVDSLDAAIEHITEYGTLHSEVIVTESEEAAAEFLSRVDAAVVYHNASSRFTDGFEFGFGAEIGISTQKLHARGPMGLREMTSYKYIVRGDGQVRG
ncbi:glutamate-5-semialdehyde dehydrogenase [Alicyclobacillus fastidiosus]|uniref:Gamma-glutamyl phosphate reductase n=1 Tax=Alicyclobacillus fastidiosus TaxID=392011 RepID=A0ABY6ZNX4_9BACL|nr:glutamate-5-semialdehyde dehydrogenase [Alicyclobacillus fastidiosus]